MDKIIYAKTSDIAELIDTAPENLNTFKELADALGNDPNYATTIMTKLENKVDKEESKELSLNLFIKSNKDLLTLRDFKDGLGLITVDQNNWEDFISYAESNNGDFGTYFESIVMGGRRENYKNILVYSGKYFYQFSNQPGINGETHRYIQYFIEDNFIYKRIIELNKSSETGELEFGSYVSFEKVEMIKKEEGKGLSTNDFTNEEKEKLAGLGEFDDAELRLRDERLKYYGDPDIIPSDESYFTFKRNPITKITSISFKDVSATVDPSTIIIDKLIIPYKYNGYLITEIDEFYLTNYTNIKEIIMPDSIEKIGDYFLNYSSVEKVKLSKNIREVGTNFITYNFNLTEINLEDLKITNLQGSSFTPNSFEKIVIPNSLKTIGVNCFCSNAGVEEIKIPDGVISIGTHSFTRCENTFKRVYIPDSVQEIGEECFYDCADDFTIYCNSGSVAEIYAINNNLNYELLNNQSLIMYPEISDSVILYHKSDIRLGSVSNLSLFMPEAISDNYSCNLCFSTSSTQPSLVYSGEPIIWHGEDCNSEGYFIPEINKTYEISIKKINMEKVPDESGNFESTSTIYNPIDENNPYIADEALGVITTMGNYGSNSDVLINLSQNKRAYYLKDGVFYEIEVLQLTVDDIGMDYFAYVLERYPDAPIGTTIYTIVNDEPVIVARVGLV